MVFHDALAAAVMMRISSLRRRRPPHDVLMAAFHNGTSLGHGLCGGSTRVPSLPRDDGFTDLLHGNFSFGIFLFYSPTGGKT
jgi:hypothetical protein